MQRSQIFISYSHADSEHMGRLRVHLRPFERTGKVEVWADSRITPGDRWRVEIRAALDRAAIAVLLVSADFLASAFIVENELPPLLQAAKLGGARIVPVILKPCAFLDIQEISQFQAVNDPRRPLVSLQDHEREQIWYDLARSVNDQLQHTSAIQSPHLRSAHEEQPHAISLEPGFSLYAEEFADPNVIDQFFVYRYEHIDELAMMPLANDAIAHHPRYQAVLERIARRFKAFGWEGDGEIRLLWFPPFVGAGVEDTCGLGTWFVKQSNNGTSFIASPVPLPFGRLLQQQTA